MPIYNPHEPGTERRGVRFRPIPNPRQHNLHSHNNNDNLHLHNNNDKFTLRQQLMTTYNYTPTMTTTYNKYIPISNLTHFTYTYNYSFPFSYIANLFNSNFLHNIFHIYLIYF